MSSGNAQQASFASTLFDPYAEAPDFLAVPDKTDPRQRLNIYRNNVRVGLINALREIFPLTAQLLGDEFIGLASAHVAAFPPRSPLLMEYGRDFVFAVGASAACRAQPWLIDLMRLERARLDAYHSGDAEVVRGGDFTGVNDSELMSAAFTPHPALRILLTSYEVCALLDQTMTPDGELRTQSVHRTQAAVLITRPDAKVHLVAINRRIAAFLMDLQAGWPLGECVQAAIARDPAFDLAGALGLMLDAGAFSQVRFGGCAHVD